MSLTQKQENFCLAVASGKSASDAYRDAYDAENCSPTTINRKAKELMDNGKIAARLEELRAPGIRNAEITAEMVLRALWDIHTADPNEIMHVRRVCCRYCHGIDHEYQWDEREFERAIRAAKTADLPPGKTEKDRKLPEAPGGFGWDRTADPHPDCPDCQGEGREDVHINDTRKLTGKAKALYGGVKVTKDGIEVKHRDQDGALMAVAKHLGMFKNEHEHTVKGAPTIVIMRDSAD